MRVGQKFKGQQAIEFVLISSLVLLAALATIMAFGGKIANFFNNDSAIAIQSKKTSPSISSTTRYFSSSDSTPSSSPVSNTNTVDGVNVNIHQDGSASFTVNNQQVNLNPNVMNNLNTVFQTTGSTGITSEVINAIKDLITTNANNYPGQSVPIQIDFGTGQRNCLGNFQGTASVNSVTLQVGKNYKIIQKDQSCEPEATCGGISTVSVTKNNASSASGNIQSSLQNLNSTSINCTTFNSTSGSPTACDISGGMTGNWNFQYNNSPQSI